MASCLYPPFFEYIGNYYLFESNEGDHHNSVIACYACEM